MTIKQWKKISGFDLVNRKFSIVRKKLKKSRGKKNQLHLPAASKIILRKIGYKRLVSVTVN